MTINSQPVIGYQNWLDHPDAVLSSSDVEAGSSLTNLVDPNLGVVLSLGTGTSKSFDIDRGTAESVAAFYIRFRGGWSDIVSVRLQLSTVSDFSTAVYDSTLTGQIPTSWLAGEPRRPIFRVYFDAVTARYARITVARTSGAVALWVARVYVGPAVQLQSEVEGIAVDGGDIEVETATAEETADIDSDFRFCRPQRRFSRLKLAAIPEAKALSEFYRRLNYAAANFDVLYIWNPLEEDAGLLTTQAIFGQARFVSALTYPEQNWWEAALRIRERI